MEFAFLRSWMEQILTNPSQSDFTEQAEDQLQSYTDSNYLSWRYLIKFLAYPGIIHPYPVNYSKL